MRDLLKNESLSQKEVYSFSSVTRSQLLFTTYISFQFQEQNNENKNLLPKTLPIFRIFKSCHFYRIILVFLN